MKCAVDFVTSSESCQPSNIPYCLSPHSHQHQISPCNINAYSTPDVMRIKDMITKSEFS